MRGPFNFLQSKPIQSVIYMLNTASLGICLIYTHSPSGIVHIYQENLSQLYYNFLTSGTVSNQICWLHLDLPGIPAADHYNVYVLFIYNIDFDCNVYIPLLFTV